MSALEKFAGWVYNTFLTSVIDNRLRKKMLKFYKGREAEYGCEKEMEFLKTHRTHVYLSDFESKYDNFSAEVLKDPECGLFYVIDNGKKLYFKRSFSEKQVLRYYKSIVCEQDEHSPHRYMDEQILGAPIRKIADLGVAEGNFTLSLIDRIDFAYLFECDDEWIEALNQTFSPYKDKVKIIKSYVSDTDDGANVRLDTALADEMTGGEGVIDIVKMDIEGAEPSAVKGAKALLGANPQAVLLLCVYHNVDDSEKLQALLPGYEFEFREGRMCWPYRYTPNFVNGRIVKPISKMTGPFMTRGVMKAVKK